MAQNDHTETIPKADHDKVVQEYAALKEAHAALGSEHTALKQAHADALKTSQGVEAERAANAEKLKAWEASIKDMALAPVVGRLAHDAYRALLPVPTIDAATGRLAETWGETLAAWETEHKALLKPATTATPTTTTTTTAPRPSTPPSTDGNPARTQEFWQQMLNNDPEQFRRRYAEFQADRKAGNW